MMRRTRGQVPDEGSRAAAPASTSDDLKGGAPRRRRRGGVFGLGATIASAIRRRELTAEEGCRKAHRRTSVAARRHTQDGGGSNAHAVRTGRDRAAEQELRRPAGPGGLGKSTSSSTQRKVAGDIAAIRCRHNVRNASYYYARRPPTTRRIRYSQLKTCRRRTPALRQLAQKPCHALKRRGDGAYPDGQSPRRQAKPSTIAYAPSIKKGDSSVRRLDTHAFALRRWLGTIGYSNGSTSQRRELLCRMRNIRDRRWRARAVPMRRRSGQVPSAVEAACRPVRGACMELYKTDRAETGA